MMDVLSSIRGLSFTLPELYTQISHNGWEVKKVKYDKALDKFVATGKAPHGEEVVGKGPTERVAVSNLLYHIVHRNNMRSSKVSMWRQNFTDQLIPIAEAYSKAAVYEPKAAIAFMELARDSERRAQALQEHLEITIVNNPEPYVSADKMCDDIRKRRKLEVSRAGIEHPLWSEKQVIAYRIVHDVLGYCAVNAKFDWEGENQAFSAHAAVVSAEAQKALFTESIANSAYAAYYRSYGPQKVALFPEFMDGVQERENPHKLFPGTHPSQTMPPIPDPSVKPIVGSVGQEDQYVTASIQKSAAGLADPNQGFQSGVQPLPLNAYLDHGGEPHDPLESQQVTDNARLIDTEWAQMNQEEPGELAQMKQAITNAFRVVLLSPRKDLRWNAIHYQDISGIPADVSDPTVYWNKLEQSRQQWNVARHGEDARFAHMPYFKQWKELEQLLYQRNPQAGWASAVKEAKQFLYRMQSRIQEQVMEEDSHLADDKQKSMYAIELESNKRLAMMLKNYIKESQPQLDFEAAIADPNQMGMDMGPQEIVDQPDKAKYGAWMGTHLQAIAQISQHVDEILKAALADVHDPQSKGAGHHFRATVLQLGISGVGPKVCSFAWLLLQPMTSQLATIDTHMMDVLGHHYEKDMSPRDYFKFERQLQAGRDAAGYGHMPLGQFQWGMWDFKRTGQGSHQDHSAMRVLDPVPHEGIDWANKAQNLKGDQWAQQGPDWWRATQPARDAVGEQFDQQVAGITPQNQIPYQNGPVYAKTAATVSTPWVTHPETGQRIQGQPGQTIMQHLRSLGLSVGDAWNQIGDGMTGKDTMEAMALASFVAAEEHWAKKVKVKSYEPGDYGKGMIQSEEDPEALIWKTDKWNGKPHHDDIKETLGVTRPMIAFHIDHEGRFFFHEIDKGFVRPKEPDTLAAEIERQYPHLRWGKRSVESLEAAGLEGKG